MSFLVLFLAACDNLFQKIKHFVVTTVSKERPSSIVAETLKHGILMPIDISKELDFYADFKRFIKFSLTHQRLQA